MSELALLVIRTDKIESLKEFYRILGLELKEEKHGNGPLHYSVNVSNLILEFYPSRYPTFNRLGLRVEDIKKVIKDLTKAGVDICEPAVHVPGGYFAYVLDPEGRIVELYPSQP